MNANQLVKQVKTITNPSNPYLSEKVIFQIQKGLIFEWLNMQDESIQLQALETAKQASDILNNEYFN